MTRRRQLWWHILSDRGKGSNCGGGDFQTEIPWRTILGYLKQGGAGWKKKLFLKQFSKSIRYSARWKCVIQVMNWFWAFVLVTVEQNKSYKHHFWLMSLGSYLIDIFSKCNLYRTTHELGSYLASDAYVSYDPWTWQLLN